ncbi:ATP-binding protein [Methylomonas sp. SURF-2]|uniref:histidine kinase n=1 Tax=Methylomonas subterranea TaxID=2952225 RepID=A0ABT1TBT2_9GAMM|nr:ATP-binding protein [Methylomonas sp. SURF-2]MCQ8102926.1 ATP-binding protein [Methylomonas sp. SURF-2]
MASFKTRARAVDMLGRQQIAGIPTAISELFKNAHDAYADSVEVDFFRNDRLFVLRDDGVGMTREEFETRWLTLGTESKLGSDALSLPFVPAGKEPRTMLGEKGIGRLAIAAIGNQVLILTRAKRGDSSHSLVAAFIHWSVFECPGLNLDEIDIPVREFEFGKLPDAGDVREMVEVFRSNIDKNVRKFPPELKERIEAELDSFIVDPVEIDGYLPSKNLSLKNDGFGTHFIIFPASELLSLDLEEEIEKEKGIAPPLKKVLLGFTNTMTPDHPPPVIKPAFRDWKSDVRAYDMISEVEFFTPQDFLSADHRIAGSFDEYGQFVGSVWIYGKEFPQHVIPWREARGEKTKCGKFSIDVAVVPGMEKQSYSDPQTRALLNSKLMSIGGVYIYRNGIRILPYGGPDVDWLDFELRRNKSAAYYFFSYRRLFGVVSVNSSDNAGLKEKAGREGFSQNKAYRDLRAILKNFFLQLAADFFRENALQSDHFITTRKELERLADAREKREMQVGEKRKKLQQSLDDFFVKLDANKPAEQAAEIITDIEESIRVAKAIRDPKIAAKEFIGLESKARKRISDLKESYKITRPRGVGLNKSAERDWAKYSASIEQLNNQVFSPLEHQIGELVGREAERARIELDRRLRIEAALEDLANSSRKITRSENTATRKTLEKVGIEVHEATGKSIANVERVVSEVIRDFGKLDVTSMHDEAIVETRISLEKRILEVQEKEKDFFQYVRAQLESVDVKSNDRLDQIEALEQSNLALEEQADLDLQLTQLGMAVQIIDHEFNGNVKSIRDNLRELKAWADVNEDLRGLYRNIRANFEHLDGYLTLFKPLDRRLRREKVDIAGDEVFKFVRDLFAARFERHSVEFTATNAFLRHSFKSFPSSFYPVFVNLVDNAVFWLSDRNGARRIHFDYRNDEMLVRDTGPGIPERDRVDVFESGFTRKPGGRGLGLYISHETLKKVGFRLELLKPEGEWNTTFSIRME